MACVSSSICNKVSIVGPNNGPVSATSVFGVCFSSFHGTVVDYVARIIPPNNPYVLSLFQIEAKLHLCMNSVYVSVEHPAFSCISSIEIVLTKSISY